MGRHFYFFIFLSLMVLNVSVEAKLKCKKCESNNIKECATDPDKITNTIDCEGDEDKCIVEIVDKNTIRKCGPKNYCEDKENCKICENAEDCSKIYPEDRPQCIQCTGVNCVNDDKVPSPLPCVNYDKDDECYVVVKDDKNAERGCMSDSDTSKKLCKDNEKICSKCPAKTNKGCNKDSEVTSKCFVCSGNDCQRPKEVKPDCQIDVKSESCKALYGRHTCYILRKGNDVTRGCLKSLPPSTADEVETCSGDNCNFKCFPDIKCPKCNSTEKPDCLQENLPEANCPEYSSVCHWCEDSDGHTYRGCGNGDKNWICNYGSSPKKPNLHCYKCDENYANCATLQSNLTATNCPKEDDECVVLIREGKTIRGCLSEIFDDKAKCKSEEYCKRCSENKCNGGVYPEDRRQCFQCSKNEECKNLPEEKIKPNPCVLFTPNDKCYTYAENNDMIRGCWSDTNKACKEDDKKCAICESSNCNKQPLSKDATLKCIKCKDKLECAWAQGKDLEDACKEKVEYWEKETCFTYQHNATVVTRGCTLDSDTCNSNQKCQKCEGDSCNNKNLLPFMCYRCRNDNVDEEKCADTAEGLKPSKCTNLEIMDYKNRGCYTRRDGDVVIRGCLIDLDTELRSKCMDEKSTECHHCLEAECNNKKPPNSSVTNKLSLLLLCFAVVIASLK